jgi:hypothetical protein
MVCPFCISSSPHRDALAWVDPGQVAARVRVVRIVGRGVNGHPQQREMPLGAGATTNCGPSTFSSSGFPAVSECAWVVVIVHLRHVGPTPPRCRPHRKLAQLHDDRPRTEAKDVR